MPTLKIGIMPEEDFQKRILNIASGEYTPKPGEPKIWFSSIKSLSEVLSDNNMRLLKLMKEFQPDTIKELAKLSGRKESNLNRTLHTMARYGIVELIRHNRSVKPVAKANAFNILHSV